MQKIFLFLLLTTLPVSIKAQADWKNSELPDSWIKAYDKETIIQDKQLYDLKAIPTIYLLDGDKTVLLRDPAFEQFEKYLNSL